MRCRRPGARWRWPAGSTSRAATTPSSSSRCGATTCAIEGVVVEYLGGVDDLVGIVEEFQPGPGRRLGVLVDHLVAGSKEARIADAVRRGPGGAHTLVVGHPFIDIWQAVKPGRLGISAWPVVPRGEDWKHGVCEALGWPHAQQADIAQGVAADPGPGAGLERPRARTHRPGRGADRLRDATGKFVTDRRRS